MIFAILLEFERLEAFMASVSLAPDMAAVHKLLETEIRRLGFDAFAYTQIKVPRGASERLYTTSYPGEWAKHYARNALQLVDPIWAKPLHTILPFLWSDVRRASTTSEAEQRVFGPGAEVGLRAGGGIPIHGPDGAVASLQVSAGCDSSNFGPLFMEHRHELHLIAIAAHERIVNLGRKKRQAQTVRFTPRQRDVLLWAIRGKTNWEIGEILGISEDTVRQHIAKICDLLGAKNRAQAAATAITRQLILP